MPYTELQMIKMNLKYSYKEKQTNPIIFMDIQPRNNFQIPTSSAVFKKPFTYESFYLVTLNYLITFDYC